MELYTDKPGRLSKALGLFRTKTVFARTSAQVPCVCVCVCVCVSSVCEYAKHRNALRPRSPCHAHTRRARARPHTLTRAHVPTHTACARIHGVGPQRWEAWGYYLLRGCCGPAYSPVCCIHGYGFTDNSPYMVTPAAPRLSRLNPVSLTSPCLSLRGTPSSPGLSPTSLHGPPASPRLMQATALTITSQGHL